MYEGAIAYYRATGKDKWLKVAEKSARHFNKVFFEGDPNYNDGRPVNQAPGHQELELALCKLYRVTGNRLYLDMAKRFLDIRGVTYRPEGEGTMSPSYAQQHKPVVEQTKAVGHAVRAGYLYAGMADVSALTGDMSYAEAAERIWHDIVDTKMHIIGGLGATHGIEGFGPAYDLPNRQTYNETCAAVANVLFNFRMYLLHKDAKYFDVAEVALLNNSLAGMGMAGDSFFYVNVLETDGVPTFNHGSKGRAEWFGCACCPSNLARLIPQVSGYMYSHTDDEIYLGLYGSSQTRFRWPAATSRSSRQSNYPFDGKIRLEDRSVRRSAVCLEAAHSHLGPRAVCARRAVSLRRRPGAEMDAEGQRPSRGRFARPRDSRRSTAPGSLAIRSNWTSPCRSATARPSIRSRPIATASRSRADRWSTARSRPTTWRAKDRRTSRYRPAVLHSRTCRSGRDPDRSHRRRTAQGRRSRLASRRWKSSGTPVKAVSTVKLIPYYAWNNRGEESMIVWLPRNESLARKYMVSNQLTAADYGKVLATHTHEGDTVAAVVDGRVPDRSADQDQPRWTSLPFKNRGQNIIFEFDKTENRRQHRHLLVRGTRWRRREDPAAPRLVGRLPGRATATGRG